MICLCSESYCYYDSQSNKFEISSKDLNERTLEDSGDGPLCKYCKVLGEGINVTSTNRRFRKKQHAVAAKERTKKGLSYLYPKRNIEQDRIHTICLIYYYGHFNIMYQYLWVTCIKCFCFHL